MIKLEKLLMIHWQDYVFQTVTFDQITLLTGQTGSGKSTVIDALNVILLGEKTRSIFNKAANENSDRNLESYLYGKMGDDGAEGYIYRREANFTSLIVGEFYDEENDHSFCCGLIADCEENFRITSQWLLMEGKIEKERFLNSEETPYTITELSQQNADLDDERKVKLIITDKEYREILRGRLGEIRDNYRRLLKQAVVFSPVKNIETFLTDFVSEHESQIDVKKMQESIRLYNDLEKKAEETRFKIADLNEIRKKCDIYKRRKFLWNQQEFIIKKAQVDGAKEEKAQALRTIENNTAEREILEIQLARIQEQKEQNKQEKEQLRSKRDSLNVLGEKEIIATQMSNLQKELAQEQKNYNQAHSYVKQMAGQLEQLRSVKVEGDDFPELHKNLLSATPQQIFQNFVEINDSMNKIKERSVGQLAILTNDSAKLTTALQTVNKEIVQLTNGIKNVPLEKESFRSRLEKHLRKMNSQAEISFLFDKIDFKEGEEKWQKAIEVYLGRIRHYLVVEPKFYKEALLFYKDVQKQGEVSGIGIINLKKIGFTPQVKKQSLATKMKTNHPLVRKYLDFILGKVIACDTILDLEKEHTAITADGFLYKGFVTTKLSFNNTWFIGRNAIKKQLVEAKKKQVLLKEELNRIDEKKASLEVISQFSLIDKSSESMVLTFGSGDRVYQKQQELEHKSKKIEELDMSELDQIEAELEELEETIINTAVKEEAIANKIARLASEITTILQSKLPLTEAKIVESKKDFIVFENDSHLSEYEAEYESVIYKEDFAGYEATVKNYRNSRMRTEEMMNRVKNEVFEDIGRYNQKYADTLPPNIEQSQIYDEAYQRYVESDLPHFTKNIEDALSKAKEEFRYSFLDKIKNNIDTLTQQVAEINRALKQKKFGEDEYRFEVKSSPKENRFYTMIMDPMLIEQIDWNLFSANFEEKYKIEMEQLFDILSGGDLETQGDKENLIQKYSDYRTYLSFDLKVKKGGVVQRLSRTYGSKSGGETQIPLYISLLAAFSQVYRVTNERNNNTIRLILMDEAFSKIDGEKIKQCVQLVRDFNLQAIFSTPPEKISEIMAEADKALVVFRKEDHVEIHDFASLEQSGEAENGLQEVLAE
ncbi:ATP-binding protein [Enterococcus sp.]|uniref:ATP-binding protein n=1 Tax=Enterococcus sp. TaxID=35783 RepID=UPI003C70E9B3